ncbi:PEGA domain-containing protein [bacterium]|nr:PEGA domain-containing protein [bacterium]
MKHIISVGTILIGACFFACDKTEKSEPADEPKGNIQISSTPAGAVIYLDNVKTENVTPFTIADLDTGLHEIRLSKSGYFDDSVVVRVQDGLTATSSFTLTLLTVPVGKIFLTSTPAGAAIFLDANPTGKITPDTLTSVLVGIHSIKLTLSNYADSTFSVSVSENVTTSQSITMRALPFGNIYLHSAPIGAAIFLDNVNSGKVTPDTLKNISSGDHAVKLTLTNYFDSTFTVTVPNANQTVSQSITMRALPVGNLFISSVPAGAAIFRNGTNSGKLTPDTLKNLTPGNHTIKLTLTGYFDSTFTATVTDNQTTDYGITLRAIPKVPLVIQNIFNANCTRCHFGSNPPQGQNLTENFAYLHIVNVASNEQPGLKRILPGNPDDSYLVRKIQGTPGISLSQMPQDGPPFLSQAEIDTIRSWVTNGALPR